jgi:two-component system nitrogen regulation sensor histidine kinase GlnL
LNLARHSLQENFDQDAILDLMDTAVVQLDELRQVITMNTAAEHCLLVGRDRALGQPIIEVTFVPPELRTALAQRQSDDSPLRLHDVKFAGGQYDCTLLAGIHGSIVLELHNLEWEHKRYRLQQRELQTGLLELLSRNLGHEIRNPLGGIRGASQMLANEVVSPEMASLARLIMREVDRIDELIQSFGQPQLAQQEVDFYPLMDEVLALVEVEFDSQAVLERDLDPSVPAIPGDAAAIRQVLLNLLQNAFQAKAKKIVIRTRITHGGALLQASRSSLLRVEIIDDGEGVPESLRNLLFLPMVTGKRSGTGLGLALSQQIAAAHGGLITYEPSNEEGSSGSCFSFFLPLEKPEPAVETAAGA